MKYWQTLGEFCLLCSFLIDNCVSFPLLTPTICQGAWRKCFLCFIVSRVLEFQMNGAWGSRLKGKSVLTSLSSPFIKPFQMYFAAEFQRRFVFQKFCFGRLEENIDLWGLRGPPWKVSCWNCQISTFLPKEGLLSRLYDANTILLFF